MADSLIAGIVVHWHAEEDLARLIAAWPEDPRFPLVVVDNGSRGLLAFPAQAHTQLLSPPQNLGFAGGANLGARTTNAPLLLFLNPDARPEASALEELAAGFAAHPEAAGLAPRLFGADGRSQHRWQLRPLPGVRALLAQVLF